MNSFIVTTSHSVIFLNIENNISITIHSGSGLYYGVAKLQQHYYVACRNNIDSYHSETEKCELIILDDSLKEVGRISPDFDFGDVHGIVAIDNEIWCTSTADNSIVIWNSDTKVWRKWYPVAERGKDYNHFNSIVKLPYNRLGLVAHNKGKSTHYIFHIDTLELIETFDLGMHAHNLWLDENNAFFTCSSAEGLLVNTHNKVIRIGDFPRGVAVSSKYSLVGMSELSLRELRDQTDGYLRCFDHDWRYLFDLIYPNQGMILDVFAVNENININKTTYKNNDVEHIKERRNDCFYLHSEQSSYYLATGQWSKPEEFRWTIAQKSQIRISYNESHTLMKIYGYNEHYINENILFLLNDELVAELFLKRSGQFEVTVKLPKNLSATTSELTISVPYLVRYNDVDSRNLGIAIKSIQFINEREFEK
ncbi:YncE family protein [Thalassotalea piscium]|uniref:WD40 repeat domain-containing protein n=1 Tax=Thalassotalea piscium TaxID=1230533 RepID=A0A7X0NG70_9GAMM|nr:hypothetical protein [Thalassotalea piscium]MBB6542780.1 hypothetical protein [Thalassotalea piscium]